MDDRFNTIAGWTLFAGIVALGSSILSGKVFHADNPESPEKPGYFIDAPDDEGGAAAEMGIAEALNLETVTASAGEALFQARCTNCHNIAQGGPNGTGPNLWGVMGGPIGKHAAGFAYSSALAGKGGVWDWDTMNEWLKSPRAFANGTKMSFAGLSNIEDRAAIALYMNENGSSLAVPEFTAEEPAAEDGAGDGEGADAPGGDVGALGDASSIAEEAGAAAAEVPTADTQ